MKTSILRITLLAALALFLGGSLQAATLLTYTDQFTLASGNLPYGGVRNPLPTNVPAPDTTALQWANTTRSGFPGSFRIVDSDGAHGGVLQADDSAGGFSLNYATNVDLAQTTAYTTEGGSELLWSVSFDLNRNGNTYNWFRLYMNYDPVTGTGLSIEFALGNGTIKISENSVASATLGNPGVILGNTGLWGSFTFERYADGTLRIVKTSGGGSGAGTDLDETITLSNSSYTTGGTMAVSFLGNSSTPNPLWVDNITLRVMPIPEPGAFAFIALGGLGLLVLLRGRSRGGRAGQQSFS